MDNGSTDETLRIAQKYATVTILETKIPFQYNTLLRRYLITRFSKKRWSLTVDIDELWDYPYSDKFSLEKLFKYLSAQGANAVIAQMLDMFMPYLPTEKVPLSAYDYYDISHIEKDNLMTKGYLDARGFLSEKDLNSKMGFLKGGIRAQLF